MTAVNQYIPGMPRGSGPLTRALVAALVCVSMTACAPFGRDRSPGPWSTLSPSAETSTAPSGPSVSGPATSTSGPTPTVYPALGPLPDGVAPARPAALDQPPTLDGAKAVATYFLLLYPYAYQTGDLLAWKALSHPQCSFCAETTTNVQQQAAHGQHATGGNVDVAQVGGTEIDVGHFFEIQAVIHETQSRTVDQAGSVIDSFAAGGNSVDMVVLFENGAWSVRGIDHKVLAP